MIFVRRLLGVITFGLIVQGCDDGPAAPKTGSLTVNIAGLPADVPAAVTVNGEVGTPATTVTSTRTLSDLNPGTYTITAAKAVGTRASYTPATLSQVVEVKASTTPSTITVGHTLSTGIAKIVITGLPPSATPAVTIFNSKGFFANFSAPGEAYNLEAGDYTIQADPVAADELYSGSPVQSAFTVTVSPTPVEAVANYAPTTGSIQFSATGLPAGAVALWDVTGTNGVPFTFRSSDGPTLSRLQPAVYTVRARNLDVGQETYGAASQSIQVTVTAGGKAPAVFAYATRPPSLNLSIEGAYITQSSQRFNGSVPLVAGRAAFMRVFIKANEDNSATPKVRVRLYRGAELLLTREIDPPGAFVPTTISERTTADSWGFVIPAEQVVGGLSYVVDVDPANTVREVDENDNTYPASGSPLQLSVRAVPIVELRFVPIATVANSLVGDASEGRIPELLSGTLRMFPIATWSADVRAPFSTNAAALVRDDANGSWIQIINELNTVRVSEGTTRHYLGILKTPYSSGVVGIGFFPGKTLLSWDVPGPASSTIAHELGHNWGRGHAPCGGPGSPDPAYPYANARIGTYGFDLTTRTVLDAELRDVMSYCSPEWVSDYTYEGIMNFRGSTAASVSQAVQPSLVVWGRMEGTKLTLEPAFMADTRPVLPVDGGRYRVEGIDVSGAAVFSISFDPERIGDAANDARQFSFAIPITQANASRIVSLRLSGDGREVRTTASTAAGSTGIEATAAGDKVSLRWDKSRYPMLVVRDPDTKEILAFARGGVSSVITRKRNLEVAASSSTTSTRLMIQVRN